MQFAEYAEAVRALGREVNPATLAQTRNLLMPLARGSDHDVEVTRDVQYGKDPRQRLDIFRPAEAIDSRRPLLVFVHGGGFVGGDKHIPGTPFYDNVASWAVRNGCNGVNLTYRLAPAHQWPSGIEDLHTAITFLKAEGAAHGIDASRIFLMGQSAGAAHAAAYVAHPHLYKPHSHRLAGLILLSGIYNFAGKAGPLEQAYLGIDETQYAKRSSVEGLLATDVPMLLTLAEHDPPFFEQQTLELLIALQARHQQMPRFIHLAGQNHLSAALYLGLQDDLLAPQLKRFIRDHG